MFHAVKMPEEKFSAGIRQYIRCLSSIDVYQVALDILRNQTVCFRDNNISCTHFTQSVFSSISKVELFASLYSLDYGFLALIPIMTYARGKLTLLSINLLLLFVQVNCKRRYANFAFFFVYSICVLLRTGMGDLQYEVQVLFPVMLSVASRY